MIYLNRRHFGFLLYWWFFFKFLLIIYKNGKKKMEEESLKEKNIKSREKKIKPKN